LRTGDTVRARPHLDIGYTGGRRGRALAGPEIYDDVVLGPHVDALRIEFQRHHRRVWPAAWDHTDVAVRSTCEFPRVLYVEPQEPAADSPGALESGPQAIKVCGQRVMSHYRASSRWPAAVGSSRPARMWAVRARRDSNPEPSDP
jgi:hypothetical protein